MYTGAIVPLKTMFFGALFQPSTGYKLKSKKHRELINDIKAVQQYTGIKDYITVMSDKVYMYVVI